jgi:hypothetical protein
MFLRLCCNATALHCNKDRWISQWVVLQVAKSVAVACATWLGLCVC